MPLYQLKCNVKAYEGDFLYIEDGVVKAVIPGKEVERVASQGNTALIVHVAPKSRKTRSYAPKEVLEARRANLLAALKTGPATVNELCSVLEIPENDKTERQNLYDDLNNLRIAGVLVAKKLDGKRQKVYQIK